MVWPTQAPVTARPSSPNTQLTLPSSPAQNVTVANLAYGRMEEKFWNIAPPSTAAAGQVVYYRVKFVMFDTQNNYDWLVLGPTGKEPFLPNGNVGFGYGSGTFGNTGWYRVDGREVDRAYYLQYYGYKFFSEVTIPSTTGITLHFRSYPYSYYCQTYNPSTGLYDACVFKGFKVEISQVGGVPTSAPVTLAPTSVLLTDDVPGYKLPPLGAMSDDE
jgi:hypothetical protein